MKNIFYSLAAISLCLFASNTALAQELKHCGTDEVFRKVTTQYPHLLQEQENLEAFTRTYNEDNQRTASVVYIVPVVFHVIHNYGSENISDAQIVDQMRILNEDYRKLNGDTSNIVSQFQGIASDAEIEFRLAQIDPNGNCTNGIDRIVSQETYIGDDGSKLNPWPRSKYLNVWVVDNISSGAAGYAYLPGTAPTSGTDGIIILATYVGSIGTGNPATCRALTHEIGHFLNLRHVWGNTNNPGVACGDDQVSDTPLTKGWTSCNLNGSTCTSGVLENVQNYMEYSYCTNMFTQGQRTRMRAALNSGTGQRSSLITSANMTATGVLTTPATVCAPKADFGSSANMICAGDNIQFSDLSWNGTATSWNWSFPGGTPASSTSQSPTVNYSTPGTYAVTLTSGNSAGNDTETKTSYITVSSTTAQYNSWQYFEGLENWPATNGDWTFKSGNAQGWAQTNTASYTGYSSFKLNNYQSAAGDVDEAISPSINITSTTPSPQITFKVAYAQKTSSDDDKLRVLVSNNCGKTWVLRYSKSGTSLKTITSTLGSAFTPSSGVQWRTETVTLNAFTSATNLRVKFEFTGDGGNNIYIDDINLMSATGLDELDSDNTQIGVYPNPIEEGSVVSFSLKEKQQVNVALYDMIGREVMQLHNGELSAGDHNIALNTNNALRAGVYFVRLQVNGKVFTRKVVVN
jgi:PKD repeat protein